MVWVILALVAVGFAVAAPSVWIARRLGSRLGAMDTAPIEGQVKMAARPVPNTGGIGIYLGIALPLACGLIAAWALGDGSGVVGAQIGEHLPGVRSMTPLALAFLISLTMLHGVGLLDDRRPMGPWVKMVVMALAALLVAAPRAGLDTRLLTLLDAHVGGPWLSVLITVIWFVAVTNAFNFIDNMDGLCAGVASVAGGCFLAAALIGGQWFVAGTLALVVGSCLGFLLFNFPPAKVFMGDGGSLVVGFCMAFLTTRTTYLPEGDGSWRWYGVLMPIVVLAIPLYDLVSVTLVRLSQGKSPFVGDLQHFSHRLVRRGLSKRAAVLVIYGFTLVTGLAGILLASVGAWQAAVLGAQVAALLGVLAVLEFRSRGDGARGLDA
ncbi:MAG: MraY family glycosyltransferase [Phycisphaerales bacterium]